MDQYHRQYHQYHHPPRHLINSPPQQPPSRYLPHPPPPLPPPPIFPDSHHPNFFHHRHHHHHPPPPPPSPHHNNFTYVSSPPHHHHHHQQQQQQQQQQLLQRRRIEDYRSPPSPRVTTHHNIPHNRNFINSNPNVVDEIDHRPGFRLIESHHSDSRVPPPEFLQFEGVRCEVHTSSSRFREDLNHEPRVRVHPYYPQEGFEIRHQHHTDRIDGRTGLRVNRLEGDFDRDRRNVGVVDRLEGDFGLDCRNLGVVERSEGDFSPGCRNLGVIGRLEDRGKDCNIHERYHPEMVVRERFELNSGDSECCRGGLSNDEVFVRGERDDAVLVDNVKMRRSSSGGGSREMSRSPIKFRGGGIEVDDDFDDRVRKEDIKEYYSHESPRKIVQKKSAFLRIQPAKPQKQKQSGFRNKFDNTTSNSSPHKGKDSNSEFLDCGSSKERVGSPVELDLAFKSNALVAKGITTDPSSSDSDFNLDNVLSNSGSRLDGESPSRVVRFKINSSNSKTQEKESSNRVRVSPMKRLSNLNNCQASDKKPSPSLSGKSNCRKASPNKNADFEKVSSFRVRKKRKAISPLSRLSSVAPSKTDSESVNSDSLTNCQSDGSMPSDTPEKQSEKDLSYAGNGIGSTSSECVDMGKIDLNESSNVLDQGEVGGQFISVEFSSEKTREKGILDAFPDSTRSSEVCLEGEQRISNPDRELTKFVEKCSSDILTEKDGVEGQDAVSLSLINNSVEEFLNSIAKSVKNRVENNNICSVNAETFDPVIVMSTDMNPVNIADKRENEVDLNRPVFDSDKVRLSSPEIANAGLSLDIDNDPSVMNTEIHGKVGSVPIDISIDKSVDFQEQQCLGSETTLVNDKSELGRDESSKTSICAVENSSVINRKRKAETEPNSLDLRKSESCLETDLSLSCTIENTTLPEKVIPEVSGLSYVESDISHGNKFTESTCDLDSNEILPKCGKKRKTLLMESFISDALGSHTSESTPLVDLFSVKSSPQLVEGITPPKPATIEEELGGETSNLSEVFCTSNNNSNSDNICKDSCLSSIESAPLNEKQSSSSENGCKQKNDGNLMVGGPNYSNEFMEIECDDIIPKSNVTLSDQSHLSGTMHVLNVSQETHACSIEKLSMDDKKSNQPLTRPNSLTSPVNLLPEFQKNFEPDISAKSGIQSFTQKSASLPLKHVKTAPSSKFTNKIKRNVVLTRSEPSLSTSQHSTVINPSNKTQTFPSKPRTWHRANNLVASNTNVKKPSKGTTPPQRPLTGKASKVHDTSYIRKGNSLVRNPATGSTNSESNRALGSSIDRSNPNVEDQIRKEGCLSTIEPSEISDGLVTGGKSALIEVPKTPPLPSTYKSAQNDIANTGKCTLSVRDYQSEETNNQSVLKSSDTLSNSIEDPGTFSDGEVQGSSSKRLIYVKRKSNQLIAASKASHLSVHSMDKKVPSSSDNNYYKRRKNQLIRASSEGSIHQMLALVDDGSKSLSQSAVRVFPGRSSKRLSNKGKSSKHSLVWKLDDSKSCGKGMDALRSGKLLSHLLPWKRTTYLSRKLLTSRKRGVLYVRSGRGFSLRRSKVLSLPGKSLKWSKSMEKRSKKVEGKANMAVAMNSAQKPGSSSISSKERVNGLKLHSGERIFRIGVFRYRMDPSRRTLQRISDEEVGITSLKSQKDARKTYVPKRLLIGSDEYVRIGNGNQLVRDPKRRTRILASEKVRWSLHTARMRLAKKRKFCQFFTRFGKCNKGEGKCPFIHDPSKIAVCTKFLNGLCADQNCKLTHKVIPERMPDCSFFLQGLCSNENCPYRHVSVNPKASICESFLRGYCAEGNECRKKHSYICPVFEASGSCPQGNRCKLYHPKKDKPKKRKHQKNPKNSKGRYFGSALSTVVDPETRPMPEKDVETKNSLGFEGDLGDFISLDVSDDDEVQENGVGSEKTSLSCEDDKMNFELDDIDALIKPIRILGRV